MLIENRPPPGILDICAIMQDDFGVGIMPAHHLLRAGAKNILFLRQSVDWVSIEARDAGISMVFGAGVLIGL